MRLREGDADHPPLSAGSAARTVVAVRGFHKFAVRDGLTESDPACRRSSHRPRPSGCRRRCRSPTSRRSSRRPGSPGTTLALRDRALLEVLYGTGARISEAVGLDVDDIDLETRTVRLRGQGQQGAAGAVGSYAAEARLGVPGARAARAVRGRSGRRRGVPQRPRRPAVAAVRLDRARQGGRARRGHRRRVTAHACGTRSRPTCSTAAPTSASSRSCSGTPRSRPRRSTPWSPSTSCARSTRPRTPAPSADPKSRQIASRTACRHGSAGSRWSTGHRTDRPRRQRNERGLT